MVCLPAYISKGRAFSHNFKPKGPDTYFNGEENGIVEIEI